MLKRSWRYYYLRLMRQHGSPEYVAAGLALGVLVGFLVPPGLQILILLLLALGLRFGKIAAILGTMVTNPFTYVPIYTFQVYVGTRLTGRAVRLHVPAGYEDFAAMLGNLRQYGDLLLAWIVGALVIGVPAAILSYYASKALVVEYRRLKQQRMAQRQQRREQLLAEQAALKGATHPPPQDTWLE